MIASGSKVHLTLKSVHGIIWKSDDSQQYPPTVNAGVAFTGSASDMQVSSFTMCGKTGHLVVESNPMELDKEACDRDGSNTSDFPVRATFNDPMEGRKGRRPSTASTSASSASSGSSCRPHMKLQLPHAKQNVPSLPLAEINRDSRIVDSEGYRNAYRAPTKSWEAEGTAIPEIIELHVTLRTEDSVICQEGIAHFIFYGSLQENGLITLDLPIKKRTPPNPNAPDDVVDKPLLCFQPEAYIRVQVQIYSENETASPATPEQVELSENFDEQKIGTIMERLREHEELAAARTKVAKLNFQDEAADKHTKGIFCNSGSELKQSLQAFFDAFRRCNQCSARKPWKGKRIDSRGILRNNSTMGSTIATRDSLHI